uniref:CSON009705 protein n=1 Tax=Culicoides sonorensis TaxID=179676 RepID=A0A336LL41_CULSO
MADMPDLSHLTPEERAIIENVMQRQKQEEDRENEIMRRKQDEVAILEDTIRQQQRRAGNDLEATCHICLKTKFADGIGHICHYCNIRCCARCGGKVTLRSNKVIWVCILCRKKQELLSKTGQWIGKQSSPVPFSRMGPDGKPVPNPFDSSDKRPKLERTRSAAEKENLPLQRTSSMLRRQYSQQEPPTCRRMSTADSGVEVSPGQRRIQPQLPQAPYQLSHSHPYSSSSPQQQHRALPYPGQSGSGEIEGLMRSHPHLVHPMQQKYSSSAQQPIPHPQAQSHHNQMHDLTPKQRHRRHLIGGPYMPHQRSFSSSEEDIRGTPEYEAGHPILYDNHSRLDASTNHRQYDKYNQYHSHRPGPIGTSGKLDVHQRNTYNRTNHNRYQSTVSGHLPTTTGLLPQVVVCDVTTTGTPTSTSGYLHHTPQGPSSHSSSYADNNNHSQFSALHNLHNQINRYAQQPGGSTVGGVVNPSTTVVGGEPDPYWDETADSRRFTERRKKTVRFDGQDSDDWSRWESERQGSQDSATKDSGIDTSSTFTSSEDSNRGDGPKHPVSWQVSADGSRMIGHMILRKSLDGEDILGLKITGGKLFPNGSRGAIVEKVKRGSIADQEGHIKPGDEVIEWNGRSLHNRSAQEVYDIVSDSRSDPQVELIVSRPLTTVNRKTAQESWRQSHSPTRVQQQRCRDSYDRCDKPSLLVTSPGSPDSQIKTGSASNVGGRYANRLAPSGPVPHHINVGGRIQIKLGFEISTLRLIVTIICAADLTFRTDGTSRSPYAKIFLLPDRSDKSKRRTKTITNSNDPRWGQTFIYSGLRRVDLNNRALEVSVWDYVRYGTNDFLGEVILELGNHPLDDEAEWYILQQHENSPNQTFRRDVDPSFQTNDMDMILTPTDHLSPPSTMSRFSDSDTTSDVDYDGMNTGRDGASISSVGSSSSPPPEVDLAERRSRRDMSPQGQRKLGGMVSKDYRTVSGVGQSYYNQSSTSRRSGQMTQAHRSHSATPGDYYPRSGRRGSLSPPDNRYSEYPVLPMQSQSSSKSATVTPSGSPKKRQLPQVPHATNRNSARYLQETDDRGSGGIRYSRHRNRQQLQQQATYRSTGMGGWERHYTGLSDGDLTSHTEGRLRPRHSLSPDKDYIGEFGDSDMESVVSVTSSAFSTQSERPRGSRAIRRIMKKHRSLPSARPRSAINLYPTYSTDYDKPLKTSTTREILSEIASGQLSSSLPNPSYMHCSMITNNDQISAPSMKVDCKISKNQGESNVLFSEQRIYLNNDPMISSPYHPKQIKDPTSNFLIRDNYLKYKNQVSNKSSDIMCMSMPDETFLTRKQAPVQQSVLISNHNIGGGTSGFVLRSAFSEQNLLQGMEVQMSNFDGNQLQRNKIQMIQHNKKFLSDSDNDKTIRQQSYLHSKSPMSGRSSSDVTPIYSTTLMPSPNNLNQMNVPSKVTTVRRRLPEIPVNRKPRPVTIHSFDIESMPQFKFPEIDPDLDGSLNGSRRSFLRPLDIVKNVKDNELNIPQLNKSPTQVPIIRPSYEELHKPINKRSRSLPPKPKHKHKTRGSRDSVSTSISVASDLLGPSKLDCDFSSDEEYAKNYKLNREKITKSQQMRNDESIGCIINEVRNALMTQSKIRQKYSDSDMSDIERKYRTQMTRDKKNRLEGKSHYESSDTKNKCDPDDDVFASNNSKKKSGLTSEDKEVSQIFSKCKSRSSSGGDSDTIAPRRKLKGELDDEVFDAPFNRNRVASYHGKMKKPRQKNELRRTSSLEGLKEFHAKKRQEIKKEKTRHSSVSINDKPSVYEYLKSPISPNNNNSNNSASSSNNANSALPNLSPHSKNGIALLSTSPKRTSLKKSKSSTNTGTTNSTRATSKSPVKKTSTKRTKNSSDYDERNREGRGYGDEDQHHKGSVRRRTDRDRQRDLERKREQEQLDGGLSSDQERGSSHQSTIDRSFSNNEGTPEDKIDGSLSDTAVGLQCLDAARRRADQRSPKTATPTSDRSVGISGMGKKSSSTSQLSATDRATADHRKRSSAGSIQRSCEVASNTAHSSNRAGSLQSISSSEGSSWSPSLRITDSGQLADFIDGLGPGQLVGRQVLGAPALGDIQLSMCRQKGFLEVEVIRARGLQSRQGSKVLPAPYVKVYLVQGKKCVAKAKTTTARKTLDPLYQQQLAFREPFDGCVLQVTVWGDYGRIEGKKIFMGVAQIMLDDLNLTNIVIGWYKLFGTTSLIPVEKQRPTDLALT